MKNLIVTLSLIIAGLSAFADNWVFTPGSSATVGTVSDGVWTFNATIDASKQTITFKRVVSEGDYAIPTSLTALDLSKDVTNIGGDTYYTIVSIDGLFGYFGANQDDPKSDPMCGLVGEIKMPGEGLTTIGGCTFRNCTNMTGTIRFPNTLTTIRGNAFQNADCAVIWENVFPDSVTSIGRIAFQKSSLSGDIVIRGASDFNNYCHFQLTKITSVTFGNQNVTFGGGWSAGPFRDCKELTNVTFGAGMAAGKLYSGGCFNGCTKLKTLDLRGFSILGSLSGQINPPLSESVKSVSISSNVTQLTDSFFNGATKLGEVHFYGPIAESAIRTTLFGTLSASQAIVSYVHLDKDDPNYATHLTDWDALTNGGKLNKLTSVWRSDIAGANYASRFLLEYGGGGGGGELGHWVYDNGVVTNKDWSFNATRVGVTLSVGECCRNPTEMSELDFSKRATDAEGNELVITSLDPKFSVVGASPFYAPGDAQHGAEYVGAVYFPTNGFSAISHCAFAKCTNLTNIWPCLPDTVSSVGNFAFSETKIVGKLTLKGLAWGNYGAFLKTKVCEVEFGPGLTGFDSAWNCATFDSCTSITNVIFDPNSKVSGFSGSTYGPFCGCTKLSGTNGVIDISSFTTIPGTWQVFPGCPVETLILGTNITSFSKNFFDLNPGYGTMSKLRTVRFLGAPPAQLASITALYAGPYGASALVFPTNEILRTEVSYKHKDAWLQYAEGGEIRARRTYWKSQYVGGDGFYKTRELCWFDHHDGFLVIVR